MAGRLRSYLTKPSLAVALAVAGLCSAQTLAAPASDPLDPLLHYRPPAASIVYDREGREIGQFFVQRRRPVKLDEVPAHVVDAFVASEDGEVYVVTAGPGLTEIAKNDMKEVIMATPAISDGLIVIRTLGRVYGIGR